MERTNSPEAFLLAAVAVSGVFLIVAANWILPENCYLFDTRTMGLLCDGIDLKNPQSCPICRDERIVSAAEIMLVFGFGLLLLPFIVYALKARQDPSTREPKLFD